MKKTLLIVTAMIMVIAVFGQTINYSACKVPRYENKAVRDLSVIPLVQHSPVIPKTGQGLWTIGSTIWEAISNSSARNTASVHPSGDMACVWTFEYDKDRGTGYNWYDKTDNSWNPVPAEMIEILDEGRPGYPSHAFTETGEINVAHMVLTGGLIALTRDQRGTGTWTQSSITDERYPNGLVWPTIAANGNTVHLMCLADLGGDHYKPLYYRSLDGGKNWDIKGIDFPKIPGVDTDLFADSYSMIVKGDHVVFLYVNADEGNVGYIESKNGGDTWDLKPVYNCNASTTEDFILIGRTGHAAIDDNDKVHVAIGLLMIEGEYMYNTTEAIIHWMEGSNVITPNDFQFTITETTMELNYLNLPNVLYFPDLLGFDEYWWPEDITGMIHNQSSNAMGAMYGPRIIAEDGKVFISYCALVEQPMGISPEEAKTFFRGVFLTVSDDNGASFDQKNNTSWISYNSNIFCYDWSKYDGPVDSTNTELGIKGTITPILISENRWPTMSMKSANDQLLLQWANTYKAGALTDEYEVFALILDKSKAGKYMNTQEICKGKWNDFNIGINNITGGIEGMIIFPNPAQNMTTVRVNSTCGKPYTLTVSNTMGQVILTEKGQLGYGNDNYIQLNVSNFTPGVYLVNVKTDNATRTQKLIVK